jgi:hypothetical protein
MTQAPPAPPIERCPRCGADANPGQEYCLDCGLRLIPVQPGVVPHLAAAWRRRLPWYPGDWIWPAAVGLVLAVAGAALAILYSHHRGSTSTIVATTSVQGSSTAAPPARDTGGAPPVLTPTVKVDTSQANLQPPVNVTTSAVPPPAQPKPKPKPTPKPKPKPSSGLAQWPAGRNGFTVVIESLPAGGGGGAEALRKARQAAAAGLPQVGVLDSGRFSSLHPGYAVVFSGIYASSSQAQAAAQAAAAKGFLSAYARQITT